MPTALTSLFSPATKIKMALELLHPPRPSGQDESVAALVERHFGQEAVDRLADPLLSGIYGGDATQLSARTVLPKLVEMEDTIRLADARDAGGSQADASERWLPCVLASERSRGQCRGGQKVHGTAIDLHHIEGRAAAACRCSRSATESGVGEKIDSREMRCSGTGTDGGCAAV